jgi:hypothetical protein
MRTKSFWSRLWDAFRSEQKTWYVGEDLRAPSPTEPFWLKPGEMITPFYSERAWVTLHIDDFQGSETRRVPMKRFPGGQVILNLADQNHFRPTRDIWREVSPSGLPMPDDTSKCMRIIRWWEERPEPKPVDHEREAAKVQAMAEACWRGPYAPKDDRIRGLREALEPFLPKDEFDRARISIGPVNATMRIVVEIGAMRRAMKEYEQTR